MRKLVLSFFILVFSASLIIALPPAGNPPIGTHYCENSGTGGEQEYVYEGNGVWSGPYRCPGGCSGVGIGHSCKAPQGQKDGSACAPPSEYGFDGEKWAIYDPVGDFICK